MVAAGGEPHLCAVSMEYELFSASKLPVSYKASVMKHVNEIKRLTTQHELHAALFPCTADNCADVTSAGQTSMTSSEDPSPFKDVSSPVDTTAVNDAVRMVPDSHCDKNNVASSFTACELNRLEEGGERCDIINFDNIRELRSSVQSSFLSEIVASDRSVNFVDDCIGLKDGLHVRCKTQDDVKPSHNVDHLSSKSVKLESSATDTVLGATSNKSLKKKSVRISNSPPTIRYADGQHKEGGDGCDSSNFDNLRELRSSVQSSFLSQNVASDRSGNFVDDCVGLKDDLHIRCKTQDDVKPSHNVDHLSSKSVKLESSATDTVLGATSSKSVKKKSVRISNSPPIVRYTDGQHKEGGDGCDIINFDNIQELRSSVQSSFLSEIVASDRSVNFVDDCIGLKDGLHDKCKTQNDVKPSHDVDHLFSKSVKSESSATDTVLGATSNKSLKKKSVRISSSPPTIRYTNRQHKEVCNGASIAVVKVSKLLCCIWLLWLHNSVKYAKVCSVVQTSSVVHSLLLLNVYIVHSSIHTVAVSSFFSY